MQITDSPSSWRVGSLVALGLLLAIPSLAQPTINPGVDVFQTSADGTTVVTLTAPADFFCPGSAPFTARVPLQGVPLATLPAGIAGSANTIVERVTAGVFSAGSATFAAVLRALQLTSINDIDIACPDEATTTRWRVDVCACGQQPTTRISARIDPLCGVCGTANGTLAVQACVLFTRVDNNQTAGPIPQNFTLSIRNMNWCYKPGTGSTVIAQPFQADTNCDGQPDRTLPPTSNFHPGWSCATRAGDCLALFGHLTTCHKNPNDPEGHLHCVNPVCDKRTN